MAVEILTLLERDLADALSLLPQLSALLTNKNQRHLFQTLAARLDEFDTDQARDLLEDLIKTFDAPDHTCTIKSTVDA